VGDLGHDAEELAPDLIRAARPAPRRNRRSRHQQVGGGIGAGLEYEYNYMGFGTRDLQFTTALSDGTPPFTEDVRDHINVGSTEHRSIIRCFIQWDSQA